jgi:hypothetical protein
MWAFWCLMVASGLFSPDVGLESLSFPQEQAMTLVAVVIDLGFGWEN